MGEWKIPLALLLVLWVGSCVVVRGQTASKKVAPANAAATNSSSDDTASPSDDGPPANADPSGGGAAASSDLWRYLTSYEFALAVLVLLFGVLVIVSASITLRGRDVTPEQALRFYGVIVILVGTILLIVAGLNNNQIAPAVGLFGTLAGYLLGKNQATDPKQDKSTEKSDDEKTINP